MNILASYNWIREYVHVKTDPSDFAKRLALSGPGVERSCPQAPAFDGMVIGEIVEVKSHPDADRLRVVVTDVGKEKIDVVCGGSNLEQGMKVLVALPGAKVRWHGEGDLVELERTKIRGVESVGMICGANEVGLEDAFPHEEKEILDMSWCKAKPGTPVAKALELEDTVFDIEVTTNRPDAFSMIGLAREAAAILEGTFTWKESVLPGVTKGVGPIPLSVKVEVPKLCTRYEAIVMTDVMVGPSPWWIKKRLRMSGIRPINTIVDITNYVMLEYGQPMHAFDYDKLEGQVIVVRKAKDKEKIETLDGGTHTLSKDDLVIADAKKPVAIAGVMGGEETGVTANTKTIVFESATFDPVSVRRTGRAINTHTDSSLRFEKGLPEDQTHPALARAVELCQSVAMGKIAGKVIDVRSAPGKRVKFPFRPEKAVELIGVEIPKKKMVSILKSLGFTVVPRGKKYEVTVPYWRERDIEGERDFAEEIARIYGYHNLPSVLPTGELPAKAPEPVLVEEGRLKTFFRGAGFTELLSYSFVSGDVLMKGGYDPQDALRVANRLSGDFEFMRPSLSPGALATIAENQGLFPEGKVFEVSNVYLKREGAELPDEYPSVFAAVYGPKKDDAYFREVKGLVEAACAGVDVGTVAFARETTDLRWHPGRASRIVVADQVIGRIGEIHPNVLRAFGIDGRVAAIEYELGAMMAGCDVGRRYEPVPQFPPVLRDLALVVDDRTEYADVARVLSGASELVSDIGLFDVYRGKGIEEGKKSVAIHLTFTHPDKTLTAEEIDTEIQKMTDRLASEFDAVVRT